VQSASANLLPTVVYVVFWVGIPFASLLVGALEVTAAALRLPGESSTAQILMLARVVHLITSALAGGRAPPMTVPVPERATYGAFVDAAVGHVATAAVGLALGPMSGPKAAIEAVAAYRRLLRAIHVHTRALFAGPHRFDVIASSATPDPRDAAAARDAALSFQDIHHVPRS